MRYSRLFGKTVRQPKKDMQVASHKFLYQAGFIRELSAGRYEYLPLGIKVFNKIIKIIDEEMEAIGSQRVSIPVMHPIEFWKKSNRDKAWGNLLVKVKDARDTEFVLSATGEGVITEMVAETSPSYKDLPIIVHQFILKVRDEIRPRGGLLRVREFVMKDAYSFHESEENFMLTYNDFYKAYSNCCERLSLKYYPVIADSGALGGDYCHEFQVPCEAGEDHIVKCTKCHYAANIEKSEFIRDAVNENEELKPFEEVSLPIGVCTIPQLVEHYKMPAEKFIKNVVYKTKSGKFVIATVTGNLQVNELKLAKAVGEDELLEATDEDLAKFGAKPGFVHSWGYERHKDMITLVVDESILKAKNLYGGYKTDTTDPINVNYDRDFKADIVADIAEAYEGAKCAKCQGKLELIRTIEFGHIFKYDTFYSKYHDAFFTDKDGEKKHMYMGAYGIGIDRAIATIVESSHDEKGIIWPDAVAPYKVHLVGLNLENEIISENVETVYEMLRKAGVEVLFDDRDDVSAGQKFADSDLIGIPYRAVISSRTGNKIEVKRRNSTEIELLSVEEFISKLK